jgi:hypothetical protein
MSVDAVILTGEKETHSEENLFQCHFAHQKCHKDLYGIESRSPESQAGKKLPQL